MEFRLILARYQINVPLSFESNMNYDIVESFTGQCWGWGNSTVISVSVYQAGDPSSPPPRSACYRKVEFYHCVIDLIMLINPSLWWV